ncbi:Golgi apyrase [Savitreella phatthalungensis]
MALDLERRAPVPGWYNDRKYAVIVDAGSSGSRVQVYSWKDNAVALAEVSGAAEFDALPRVEKGTEDGVGWMRKFKPGISTFADDVDHVGKKHIKDLLKHAKEVVPEHLHSQTPFYLMATAGMRLVEESKRDALMAEACRYAKEHSDFAIGECRKHFSIISGETEGLFGWMAINYLLGGFDKPSDSHAHTWGFLDMGGASAQIAFAPTPSEAAKHADDLQLLRLRTLSGDTKQWRVFVTTWLGFGANEARRRYLEALTGGSDPCLPRGLEQTEGGKTVVGTGSLTECLTRLEPLLDKEMPCPDAPCLFAGVHVPAIDFDINHFIGISEYYYSAEDIFGLGGAYDYNTLSHAVSTFCARDWPDIEADLAAGKYGADVKRGKLADVCFKAAWIMNVLHDGIGVPRLGKDPTHLDPEPIDQDTGEPKKGTGTDALKQGAKKLGYDGAFNSAESLEGTEVSWTLGQAVLLASADVAGRDTLTVGYGSLGYGHDTFETMPGQRLIAGGRGIAGRGHGWGFIGFWGIILCLLLGIFFGKRSAVRRLLPTGLISNLFGPQRRKVMGARGEAFYEPINNNNTIPDPNTDIELGQATANGLPRSQSAMRLSRRSSDS